MPEYNDITIDELCEFVEMAEETALSERAAFGFVTAGYTRHMWEFDPDEVVCFYEYGVEHDGFGDFSFEDGCWPEERPLFELF